MSVEQILQFLPQFLLCGWYGTIVQRDGNVFVLH